MRRAAERSEGCSHRPLSIRFIVTRRRRSADRLAPGRRPRGAAFDVVGRLCLVVIVKMGIIVFALRAGFGFLGSIS